MWNAAGFEEFTTEVREGTGFGVSRYSAFKNFDPAPKFGHFGRFSEYFSAKKSKCSNLSNKTSPKREPARQILNAL